MYDTPSNGHIPFTYCKIRATSQVIFSNSNDGSFLLASKPSCLFCITSEMFLFF